MVVFDFINGRVVTLTNQTCLLLRSIYVSPFPRRQSTMVFPSNLLVIMTTQTSTRVQAPDTLFPATRTDARSRPRASMMMMMMMMSMTSGTQSPSWDGARLMNGAAAREEPTFFDLRMEFHIGTWTVLTLAKTGYTEAICQELSKYRISLADLTETHLLGSGRLDIYDHTMIQSCKEQEHRRGVALVLDKKLSLVR